MLQNIEVLPHARAALRRAVRLECRVVSRHWDEPLPHVATQLSTAGMWLEAPFPLAVDEPLVVQFRLPRDAEGEPMFLLARVRRVALRRRQSESPESGMGIVFVGLLPPEEAALRGALRGLPPPLPPAPQRCRRELLWVDAL